MQRQSLQTNFSRGKTRPTLSARKWIRKVYLVYLSATLLLFALLIFFYWSLLQKAREPEVRCAINFFGLPRSFRSLVLPSLKKNILPYNQQCDYFVHYYYQTQEQAGRSGSGGSIDPNEILLLKQHLPDTSHFVAVYDTEESFWKQHQSLLEKIRTTKKGNQYYYFPYKARTYHHPTTTDNIIKMWHSIQRAFESMETFARKRNILYDRVAMLRSDVLYVTPLKIRDGPDVVVPDFSKYPVSDRSIYGAYPAVKVWATKRFELLEEHVQFIYKNDPGWGLHSERFVNYTLFPHISYPIAPSESLCFLRVRADQSVWVTDCSQGGPENSNPKIMKRIGDIREAVETAIGRSCPGDIVRLNQNVKTLDCHQ